MYGAEKGKAVEIAVDPKILLRILHSESGVNTLIGLEGSMAGDTRQVLVKEYQLDPIDHQLLHADFYAGRDGQDADVTVPIVLKGEPKGVKQQGGIVDFVNREIEIECLPGDIPEHIDVDISELMLHQGIRVRDLHDRGAKWKPVSEPDMMIVHVVALKVEEAPAPTRGSRGGAGRAGRARSHQEGQDRQGQGREEVAASRGIGECSVRERCEAPRAFSRRLNEARCRVGQPGPQVRRARATTSGFDVRGPAGARGTALRVGSGAGATALIGAVAGGGRRCSPSR